MQNKTLEVHMTAAEWGTVIGVLEAWYDANVDTTIQASWSRDMVLNAEAITRELRNQLATQLRLGSQVCRGPL